MIDVQAELHNLGLEAVRTDAGANGPEARMDCLYCKAKQAFSINLDSGLWHCHKCPEKGNLFQLRMRLKGDGPRLVKPGIQRKPIQIRKTFPVDQVTLKASCLEEDQTARDYLCGKRGLDPEIVDRFRLGSDARNGGVSIAIPYLWDGKCYGYKYRHLPPNDKQRKYDREPGCILPLFNQDALKGQHGALAITEGEFDTMALTQYDLGMPVVSIPNGATAHLDDDAAALLAHFDEILIVFDQDDKGEEGAEKLAERLGAFRCKRVRLPYKDANECLTAGVPRDEMANCFSVAGSYYESSVKSLADWKEALLAGDKPGMRPKLTGWATFDKLLGGVRAGEMTLLTAETGVGKTTWSLDMARHLANNDHAVFLAMLETPPIVAVRKILSSLSGIRWDRIPKGDMDKVLGEACKKPVYILDKYGALEVRKLRDEVEYAVRRHGVTLAVVDHLHFMLGLRKRTDDERWLIDEASLLLKNMAMDLGIHVVVVMHPSKIRPERDGRIRDPGICDLKGSSGPGQFADNVAVLARKRDTVSALTFLKVRSELGQTGTVLFNFDPDTLRFNELPPKEKAPPPQPHWSDGKDTWEEGRE